MDLQSTGMEFSEMIMKAAVRDITTEEGPIVYHGRAGEAALASFRDRWRHIESML